ncbi:MAG: hypothetical protein ACFFCS_05315 [Candidatus Hodarchaeota archaeon]
MILQDNNFDWVFWSRTMLFVAFIIILLAGSLFIITKASKVEMQTTRRILQGYALFGICFALTRVFFLLSTFELRRVAPIEDTFLNNIWIVNAYTVTMASIIFVFRVVEHYILTQKPVFTMFAVASFSVDVLALILTILQINIGTLPPKDLALWIQTIVGPVLGIAICVLYIRVIKNSTGHIKSQAIKTLIGIILILGGILLDTSLITFPEAIAWIRSLVTPIIFIIGVLLVFNALIENIKES